MSATVVEEDVRAYPPISEEHEDLLRTALKLEPTDELPRIAQEIYWDFERTARRIGQRLDGNSLVVIAILAGRPTPADPVSFLDTVKDNQLVAGTRVLGKFRNKWRWGFYKRVTEDNRVIVQLDDDSAEDREFLPTSVRLPTREESKKIGEN